jgi:hypothetical protein
MEVGILIRLHNVYDNMILGHIELAHKELGEVLTSAYFNKPNEPLQNECSLVTNTNGCDKGTGCRYPNCAG